MKAPVRVTVTGPAGQIGYATLFRIASGAMFGPDQPVFLTLLERANPTSAAALKGVMMELSDCAFPLLAGMRAVQDPVEAFRDCEVALLIGARPRGPGMERADLLEANAAIFRQQGQALNVAASRNVKVLVVGNPCNTNAWIAMKNAPDLDPKCFSAMLRLDQNRAMSQLAEKTGAPVASIEHMAVWGNHSPAMVPDITFATVEGKAAPSLVDDEWVKNDFMPTVAKRELRRFRRQCRHRPHPRLVLRLRRPLGHDGRSVRRLLRRPRRHGLRLPLHREGGRLVRNRQGSRTHRGHEGPHREERRRASG